MIRSKMLPNKVPVDTWIRVIRYLNKANWVSNAFLVYLSFGYGDYWSLAYLMFGNSLQDIENNNRFKFHNIYHPDYSDQAHNLYSGFTRVTIDGKEYTDYCIQLCNQSGSGSTISILGSSSDQNINTLKSTIEFEPVVTTYTDADMFRIYDKNSNIVYPDS